MSGVVASVLAMTLTPLDAPLVLVPPLMVTAEIYDMDPTTSTVTMLAQAGVDVWVVDFGSLKSLKGRHRDNRVIRRRGRTYVINKTNRRFKARQG